MLNIQYMIQPIATCITQVFGYICLWDRRHHLQFTQLLNYSKSCHLSDLGVGYLEASESKSLLVCGWLQLSPHLVDITSCQVVSERLMQQLDRGGMLVRTGEKWMQIRDDIPKRRFEKRRKQSIPCGGR